MKLFEVFYFLTVLFVNGDSTLCLPWVP